MDIKTATAPAAALAAAPFLKQGRASILGADSSWVQPLPVTQEPHLAPSADRQPITPRREFRRLLFVLGDAVRFHVCPRDEFGIAAELVRRRVQRQRQRRRSCTALLSFCLWVPKVSLYATVINKAPDEQSLSDSTQNKRQQIRCFFKPLKEILRKMLLPPFFC